MRQHFLNFVCAYANIVFMPTSISTREGDLAATLIAQIGARTGLSQAELARRAGIDRSVLNAYAHGRRQPSVAALGRIARGAGFELDLVRAANDAAMEHAGRVLSMVLDLAESLPFKERGELEYPPLIRLRSQGEPPPLRPEAGSTNEPG